MSEEPTTEPVTAPRAERAAGRPSDGLSLADLRETVRLRQDLTRLEDENRFMREQLGHAMSGWRDEQRRTKALEQTLQALPAPAEPHTEGGPPPDAPPPPTPARPAGDPPAPPESPGFWVRLWQSLLD